MISILHYNYLKTKRIFLRKLNMNLAQVGMYVFRICPFTQPQ